MTEITIEQYDDAAKQILADAAAELVKGAEKYAVKITPALIKQLLAQKVAEQMPGFPDLPQGATVQQILIREQIAARRASIAQVNALAEKQNQEAHAAFMTLVGDVAKTTAKSLLGITAGLAFKALLGA